MSDIALNIDHVTKQYPGAAYPALNDVSLHVHRGDIMGIIGHSGAGKSTLVRMMNGLETPDTGTVSIGDFVISSAPEKLKREHRLDIGVVFQHFNLFSSRTVAANIAYPLKIAGWKKAARKERVKQLLDYVGLTHLAGRYPEQLSGGQKQRVGIARALAASPKILLADEATSALDPDTTRDVLHLLQQINRDLGLTIIVVTHHMSVVREICDHVAVLSKGKIVEEATVYDFFAAPQSKVSQSFLPSLGRIQEGEYLIDVHTNPDWLTILTQYPQLEFQIARAHVDQMDNRQYGALCITLSGPEQHKNAFLERIAPGNPAHHEGELA